MLCYCIYKMAFQKIIIVLELIDVFNWLRAWNVYLLEGRAAVRKTAVKAGRLPPGKFTCRVCLVFIWFRCYT